MNQEYKIPDGYRLMPVKLTPALQDAIVEAGHFRPKSLWAAIIAKHDLVEPAAPAAAPAVLTDVDIERMWNEQRRYHGGEPCKLGHLEYARAIERHITGQAGGPSGPKD